MVRSPLHTALTGILVESEPSLLVKEFWTREFGIIWDAKGLNPTTTVPMSLNVVSAGRIKGIYQIHNIPGQCTSEHAHEVGKGSVFTSDRHPRDSTDMYKLHLLAVSKFHCFFLLRSAGVEVEEAETKSEDQMFPCGTISDRG